jgi:acetylornithine deacetylase/succinyl-diaminopimelate desuccinylase-like protein
MIRIPSVNYGEGKGDEKAMAEYVAAKLSEVGISSELIETAPNRVNVVANFVNCFRNFPIQTSYLLKKTYLI